MAKHDASSDLSLAMVDVITNGLAATFVLFFIMVILQEDLAWSDTDPVATTGRHSAEEPLIMHVTSDDGSPLLPRDAGRPWQIQPSWKAVQLETGHNFSVLYAPAAPPRGTTILFKLPDKHPPCQIQVVHGLKRQTWSVARDALPPASLWPLGETRRR